MGKKKEIFRKIEKKLIPKLKKNSIESSKNMADMIFK